MQRVDLREALRVAEDVPAEYRISGARRSEFERRQSARLLLRLEERVHSRISQQKVDLLVFHDVERLSESWDRRPNDIGHWLFSN
jgi:hypothetical protein